MKFFLLVLSSLALLSARVFSQSAENDGGQQSSQQVVSSLDTFTDKFYSQMASAHPEENLLISPFSILSSFFMVSRGAKSETLRQILEGLSLDSSETAEKDITKGFQQLQQSMNQHETSMVLNTTNACFVDKDLNLVQKFVDDMKMFQSEVISTDFKNPEEAKDQINNYVEEKSNGMMRDMLDSLDPDTALTVINVIYYRGTWEDVFDKTNTHEEDFHVDENTVVKVPMMRRDGQYPVAFLNDPDCTVVEVPYKGNVSAFFIIPNGDKMEDVEKAFPASMSEWMKKLQSMRITLSIPRFSVSATIDLEDLLQNLGIKDVFSDNADLSGITEGHKLKVSKAMHRSVVTMDEEGTEAAAATAIGIVTTSLPPEVKANHPFLLTIINKENNVTLFTGRIINPKE